MQHPEDETLTYQVGLCNLDQAPGLAASSEVGGLKGARRWGPEEAAQTATIPPLLPGPRERCVWNRIEGWSDWGCGLEPEVSQGCSWEASTGSKEACGEEEAGLRAGNRSESLRGVTHCTYAQKHTHVHTCLLRTGLIRGVAEGCLRQPGSGSEESARPEKGAQADDSGPVPPVLCGSPPGPAS